MKHLSLILFILVGCSSSPKMYTRNPLVKQRLVVRTAYPEKLTNQICTKFKENKCETWDVKQYDLNDANFRKQANRLRITCFIANEYWRICIDKPGYCRRTLTCVDKFLFWCKKYEELYIEAKEHEFLLNANTYCQAGSR